MVVVFIVETNSKTKSDYIYIKQLVSKRYNSEIKFEPIYMNGKGNYRRQESKVEKLINMYVHSGYEKSDVIINICIDIDNVTSVQEANANRLMNNKIKEYCGEKGYNFIWFYETIEEVFVGNKVNKKKKAEMAEKFLKMGLISNIDETCLGKDEYIETIKGTSNILYILDRLLMRKD